MSGLDAVMGAILSPVTPAVAFMAVVSRALRRGTLSAWFFGLPGVIAHESAHWIAAHLTGARPESFRPWPGRLPSGQWALGAVRVARLTMWNRVPVALAPLALLAAAVWGWSRLASSELGLTEPLFWLSAYLIAIAFADAWPSGTDWRIAAGSWAGLLFWLVVLPLVALFVFKGVML